MHELGITQSLVDIALRTAREHGSERILAVHVAVGELSGVVPEAMEFAYEACTSGTELEGSELKIERIPGRGRCRDCEAETALDPYTFACAACGSYALDRLQGEELRITELEVE